MKASEILPGRLWQRGRTNHLSRREKRLAAREIGLTMVVAVCPRPDEDWAEMLGIQARALPFADGATVPDGVPALADEVAEHVRNGGRAMIYCNAGRNRSSLLSILVMMRLGYSYADALAMIREHRPNALANERFQRYLERA